MAAHAARRLLRMNDNLNVILGIEAICGAQGIAFRAPLQTSPQLQSVINVLRGRVVALTHDRYLAADIENAAAMVADGSLAAALDLPGWVTGAAE